MLRALVCEADNSFTEVEDTETISELLDEPDRYIWLDLQAPSEEEFKLIAQEFNLHPLAIEDAHVQHQRPKVEQYNGFYFVVFYSVGIIKPGQTEVVSGRTGLDGTDFFQHETDHPMHNQGQRRVEPPAEADQKKPPRGRRGSWLAGVALRKVDEMAAEVEERVILRELAMFMGPNFLVTVHADPIPQLAEAERRWRANAGLLEKTRKIDAEGAEAAIEAGGKWRRTVRNGGARPAVDDIGILLYSLLDSIVDDYFPVIDSIVDRVEEIEEQIFEQFSDRSLQSIFTLKKDLLALRKVLTPERDVLNVLTRRDLPIFSDSTIVYFQDIYDHVVRITESIDTYRDLLSSALDSYLSTQSNRLNVTVQTLTTASIILMSMTLIAGIYGMNFDIMPEIHWTFGYPFALGLMVLVAVLLYFYFKRKGWL